ncbi:MAG TPA: hypothetical protein VLV78_23115 [Thermoanaerobaculia bacterium]|nr:hypothetical protein [Thermoanaerobaculia bacterium]
MKRAVILIAMIAWIALSLTAAATPATPVTPADCKAETCALVSAWMSPDQSPASAALVVTLQKIDASLGQQFDQQQVNGIVLNNAGPTTLPNANDLVYSTLLGKPYFASDPRGVPVNSAFNYAMHASAADHPHVLPSPSWSGRQSDQAAYARYVNTVLAAQSFGANVLSNHASSDTATLSPALRELLSEASDPNAAAAVASEDIGVVVRQLLLVERQNLVLLSQLVQTEKQLLAAQAITNALLISTSPVETQLLEKATGAAP